MVIIILDQIKSNQTYKRMQNTWMIQTQEQHSMIFEGQPQIKCIEGQPQIKCI